MKKFDKLFAGMILLAMGLFWFVLTPANTSRQSEAAPVTVTPAQSVETKSRRAAPTRVRTRELSRRDIERLKRRDRDTPNVTYAQDRFEDEGPAPSGPRTIDHDFQPDPNRPIYY